MLINNMFIVYGSHTSNNSSSSSFCEDQKVAAKKDQEAEKIFFAIVLNEELDRDCLEVDRTSSLVDACEWYKTFLYARFKSCWSILLCPVLKHLECYEDGYERRAQGDLFIVFDFLSIVASELRSGNSLGGEKLVLKHIIDRLHQQDILKPQSKPGNLIGGPEKLVWAAIGWICKWIYL